MGDKRLEALARNVKSLRHERGLTQEQVADRSGLHLTYVAGIESGRRNPTFITLVALAAGLTATPADLITGIEASAK